jgi:hypothetical protein
MLGKCLFKEAVRSSNKALIHHILDLDRHERVTGAATGSEKSDKFLGVKLDSLI